MSQHDYIIANDTGANVRADMNLLFGAIATINSGTTAPSTTYAYQLWVQSNASGRKLLWQRNAANTAWFLLSVVDATPLQGYFMVRAQDTPDMTVKVQSGLTVTAGRTILSSAAQNTGTITAPAVNPRKDIVCINPTSGAVSVITGTEAASPADPVITEGLIPLARITLATSTTSIGDSLIDDLRNLTMGAVDARSVTLARSAGLVTVGNTTTETALLSFTLAGGALATNRAVRFKCFGLLNHDGTNTLTVRLKYGATTVVSRTLDIDAAGATNKPITIDAELRANNSASAQSGIVEGSTWGDGGSFDLVWRNQYGTGAETSSGDLTLQVTVEWGTADASDTLSMASEAILI